MNKLICRAVCCDTDIEQIIKMDELSGNSLEEWAQEEGQAYVWGAFINDIMIGYCSIGGADDLSFDKKNIKEGIPLDVHNHLLLSDVYIQPEYRGNGYGLQLIAHVIQEVSAEGEGVFLTVLYDELGYYYSNLGFNWVMHNNEYAMYRPYSKN